MFLQNTRIEDQRSSNNEQLLYEAALKKRANPMMVRLKPKEIVPAPHVCETEILRERPKLSRWNARLTQSEHFNLLLSRTNAFRISSGYGFSKPRISNVSLAL